MGKKHQYNSSSGARPANRVLIKFKMRAKFDVLRFKVHSADHNKILHMSRQCNCRDMRKNSLQSIEHILNYLTPNSDWISNLIEILLIGQGPVQDHCDIFAYIEFSFVTAASVQQSH